MVLRLNKNLVGLIKILPGLLTDFLRNTYTPVHIPPPLPSPPLPAATALILPCLQYECVRISRFVCHTNSLTVKNEYFKV